jgi:hypothetical protein
MNKQLILVTVLVSLVGLVIGVARVTGRRIETVKILFNYGVAVLQSELYLKDKEIILPSKR